MFQSIDRDKAVRIRVRTLSFMNTTLSYEIRLTDRTTFCVQLKNVRKANEKCVGHILRLSERAYCTVSIKYVGFGVRVRSGERVSESGVNGGFNSQ